ncbi:hypothetical protein HMPREF1990_01619 [Porphyromonas gingivalis W4087]|nr:hypothetical protein HMPREF1990_01619 [Porphyromonas gingivalis W4087]
MQILSSPNPVAWLYPKSKAIFHRPQSSVLKPFGLDGQTL